MKLSDGIEVLEIPAAIMGKQQIIYPTLIWDDQTVLLVDTGFPGQSTQIREAAEGAGAQWSRLNTVILTHQDIDHIGNLASIQRELPGQVRVLAAEAEKPYIQGDLTPVKLAQLEANLPILPEGTKAFYQKLKTVFEDCRVQVDQTLNDGDELAYGGGITVIATPGHTPGHICLYLHKCKTLVAGDALAVENGALTLAPASTNLDENLCRESLKAV